MIRLLKLPPGTQLPMDSVPTPVVLGRDGAFYVGELTGFPFPVGGARIYRVVPGHAPQIFADGFTNVIDIAFARDGSLLVLEIARSSLLSDDEHGALIRLNRDGSRTSLIIADLIHPTAIAVRGDAVYISNLHPGHAEWAIRAAQAGKHALVEKPFSMKSAASRVFFINTGVGVTKCGS